MNITREFIEQLNMDEPYCFKNGREEQWFYIGLKYGLEAADNNPKLPWISVKNDLPCNHKELISPDKSSENLTVTEYVVAEIYGYKVLSRMYELDGKWYWETDEPTHWFPIDPTRWFPIPEPPKEQQINITKMKKINGDVIAAIIFMLCILTIQVVILYVFWVKISPILTISLVIIFMFLIMNCKQRLDYDNTRKNKKES